MILLYNSKKYSLDYFNNIYAEFISSDPPNNHSSKLPSTVQ